MKNHKILSIQILLCIVPLFVPISAKLMYDDLNFHIFDNQDTTFESEIFDALQTTTTFFAQKDLKTGDPIGLSASSVISVLEPIARMASVVGALLAEDKDWMETFSRTIANETRREITLSQIQWMEASMETIQRKFELMNENNTDMEYAKTIASIIHTDVDKMFNFFTHKDSLFRKYPLIGTPLIIELALLIAYFDPLAKLLLPLEGKSPELSCKMRNILLDYRPRAVYARLDKLRLDSTIISKTSSRAFIIIISRLVNAMSKQYNQFGYNETIPAAINCKKDCGKKFWLCLKDDFATDGYFGRVDVCVTDYALLIRYRVEKLFPVELLNRLCVNPPETSGFGWLTINLRDLQAFSKWDDYKECDAYVKLFIDDKVQLETPVKPNDCCYDLNVTYRSAKISKSTLIKIEVWDATNRYFGLTSADDLILRTEGNIESFIRDGHRAAVFKNVKNYIIVITFWQDEYK